VGSQNVFVILKLIDIEICEPFLGKLLKLLKNSISSKKRNFGQKSKVLSKIEILVKNQNFGQKSKFWSNIEFFVKYQIFCQISIFLPNIEFCLKKWATDFYTGKIQSK